MAVFEVEGKKFDTRKSTKLCDTIIDYARVPPRYKELYVTARGNFIIVYRTRWQGEMDSADKITKETAWHVFGDFLDPEDIKKYFADIEEV